VTSRDAAGLCRPMSTGAGETASPALFHMVGGRGLNGYCREDRCFPKGNCLRRVRKSSPRSSPGHGSSPRPFRDCAFAGEGAAPGAAGSSFLQAWLRHSATAGRELAGLRTTEGGGPRAGSARRPASPAVEARREVRPPWTRFAACSSRRRDSGMTRPRGTWSSSSQGRSSPGSAGTASACPCCGSRWPSGSGSPSAGRMCRGTASSGTKGKTRG
jgi:hypothetical protein